MSNYSVQVQIVI